MRKALHMAICSLITLFLLTFPAQGKEADGKSENTGQVVTYLIEQVARSHLTFIRNGEGHSCEEAAKHAQTKYEYFKSRIETAEDFIRLCASKSLISGKPYLVVTPQGEVTLESWLGQILMEYRRTHEHGPAR